MTTRTRALTLGLLVLALELLDARPGHTKPCLSLCQTEIATCQTGCSVGRRGIRRRCRIGCKREMVRACREFPDAVCLPPPPTTTTTTPAESTTSSTTEPPGAETTTTTTEPSIDSSTTSTTLPGDPGAPTGFFPYVEVESSGVTRTYSLFVPPSYDPARAYPLVFVFHGDGGTGAGVREALPLEAKANGAAIFVYPDATPQSGRHWSFEFSVFLNPDMRLVIDIIAELTGVYNLDPARRFATGVSSGAIFVNVLNCTLGTSYFRAIAPHSGSGPASEFGEDYDQDGHFTGCQAPAAPAIVIHGANDDEPGVSLAEGDYTRRQWAWRNGCDDTTSNVAPSPCVEHDNCAAGPVDWCVIPGVGHWIWDQAPQAIWGFFSRFLGDQPPPGMATMQIRGRDLYDTNNEKVLLRGVNKMNVWTDPTGEASFPQIQRAGANTVRIVWTTGTTAQALDTVIGNAIDHELIPMIELHDATSNLWGVPAMVDYWTRDDVVAVIRKYERFLLVNIANEAGAWDTSAADFAAVYRTAIARMRDAGIRTPLVIDAPDSGKNIDVLFAKATELQTADPQHNLLFSVHVYWAISWGMGGGYIWDKLGAAFTAGMPLVIGEFSQWGAWTAPGVSICAPAGEVDYQTVLQAAHAYGIGWYAWEWGPGNDGGGYPDCTVMDMTTNNALETLKDGWASDVVHGPYGIGATSVIPASIKNP